MYILNGIILQIVKSYSYIGEYRGDPRDGMSCFVLKSEDERYTLITDQETLSTLQVVK